MSIIEPSSSVKRATITFDRGDVAFIIISAALVSFMIPGLAFLYSGLARRKSALALAWTVCASNAVVIFQWFLWGHSLAFSPSGKSGFIGDLAHMGLRGVMGAPSAGSALIPDLLYAFLQMQYAAVTVGIIVGGVAERGRVMPAMIFSFLWVTIVYCPLSYWIWNVNGWAFKWGVADFSGGGPVEIGSGVTGLVYAMVLGKRQEKELANFRTHNVSFVVLGTWILWFGWVGFNAGSAYGANLRAVIATWNSFLCAAFAGITWCLIVFCTEKKWTMVGLCSGTIAGLVASTPSSGFVSTWAACLIGVAAGSICNFATKFKFFAGIDDELDIFAAHGVGGIIGLLANAFFSDSRVVALDGISAFPGGWVNQNWGLLYKQFIYICTCTGYTFGASWLIAKGLDMIPGLHLRASCHDEAMGMDATEIGEYAADYIEARRDFVDWTLPTKNPPRGTIDIHNVQDKITVYPGKDRSSVVVTDGITSHILMEQLGTASDRPHASPRGKITED
ncbi:ammonium transporter [Gautieria morchelliformis]|nr:ammonium transporter [Gautieria morchelliformis]